jgi:4-hydroxybenzoate polyprenyltransferase
VGAWFAVTGEVAIIPFVLGAVVMLWVAGFDIIYGTQDIEFDRQNNLFSIPAAFGLKGALFISRAFHVIMVILLISLYFVRNMSWVYLLGISISAVLLGIEHYIVSPLNEKKMKIASYHLNQVISPLILLFTALDTFM